MNIKNYKIYFAIHYKLKNVASYFICMVNFLPCYEPLDGILIFKVIFLILIITPVNKTKIIKSK